MLPLVAPVVWDRSNPGLHRLGQRSTALLASVIWRWWRRASGHSWACGARCRGARHRRWNNPMHGAWARPTNTHWI